MIDLRTKVYVGNNCAYTGITKNEDKIFDNGRKFKIIIYGAYNAFGLIGPEKNGVAIFDNDERRVVLDEHFREGTGYFGPSSKQLKEFDRIMEMEWSEFVGFVNNHPRWSDPELCTTLD